MLGSPLFTKALIASAILLFVLVAGTVALRYACHLINAEQPTPSPAFHAQGLGLSRDVGTHLA